MITTTRFKIVLVTLLALVGSPLAAGQAIIVDHTCTNLSLIPDAEIVAAAVKRLVARHASVGANINDGLDALATSNSKYNRGNWAFPDRGNPGWQEKVDDLAQYTADNISSYDVFTMKFCFIDTDADWIYYRDKMLQLESAYPAKVFIWWTMPIMTSGSSARDAFNNNARSYCQANGKILFDIADIESHDPSGNHLMNGSYERMFSAYSSDGGHLNDTGGQRVASGLWWLMARIAGWDGGSQPPIIATPDDLDSDGDGFSDVIETALVSNPNNAAVTPFSLAVAQQADSTTLLIGKISIKLKFNKTTSDSISFSGTLPIPAEFSAMEQWVILNVGGVVKAMMLDARGASPRGSNDSFKLSFKAAHGVVAAQTAKYKLKLNKGDFAAALANDGLINDDIIVTTVNIPVTVVFNNQVWQKTVSSTYSAKIDKRGATK